MTGQPIGQATWSASGVGEQLWFLGTLALPPPDAPRPSGEELARIFEANGQVNVGPSLGPDD